MVSTPLEADEEQCGARGETGGGLHPVDRLAEQRARVPRVREPAHRLRTEARMHTWTGCNTHVNNK